MTVPNIDINMLDWWTQNKAKFKYLYRCHIRINCVPATSAASERVFSSAGNIISEKRTRLNSSRVDHLIVLNSYYKTSEDH